jgi:hypothetical protein
MAELRMLGSLRGEEKRAPECRTDLFPGGTIRIHFPPRLSACLCFKLNYLVSVDCRKVEQTNGVW